MLRAGVEDSRGLQQMGFKFCLSVGTLSNYIRHVAVSILRALSDEPICMIKWSDQEERKEMKGMVYGFTKCVAFVDGMKQHTFPPKGLHPERNIARKQGHGKEKQLFSGHHHTFGHSTLVLTDVFGILIRLDINLSGRIHERRLYNNNEPYCNPSSYFHNGQQVLEDTGFQGDCDHIVFPSKRNQCYNFELLGDMIRDIRKQRIRNEWSADNRLRLLLARWALEDNLFKVMFNVAGPLINHRIRRSGHPPIPIERMMERLELYECGEI